MSDLVQRLRESIRACRALDRSELLEEAAAEIERLRAVTEPMPIVASGIGSVTLTDAEREAVAWASLVLRNMAEERDQNGDYPRRLNETAALMLNLLQRLK